MRLKIYSALKKLRLVRAGGRAAKKKNAAPEEPQKKSDWRAKRADRKRKFAAPAEKQKKKKKNALGEGSEATAKRNLRLRPDRTKKIAAGGFKLFPISTFPRTLLESQRRPALAQSKGQKVLRNLSPIC